jgi:hypothetical protein
MSIWSRAFLFSIFISESTIHLPSRNTINHCVVGYHLLLNGHTLSLGCSRDNPTQKTLHNIIVQLVSGLLWDNGIVPPWSSYFKIVLPPIDGVRRLKTGDPPPHHTPYTPSMSFAHRVHFGGTSDAKPQPNWTDSPALRWLVHLRQI